MSDAFRGETSLSRLLSSLRATLHEETYIFASIPDHEFNSQHNHLPVPIEDISLFFREPHQASGTAQSAAAAAAKEGQGKGKGEGKATAITLILRLDVARKHDIQNYTYPCRMITCDVHSSLEAVGFMAVLATKLAERGISVNPVSGFYHDHLFVPVERAEEAVAVLEQVRDEAVRSLEAVG